MKKQITNLNDYAVALDEAIKKVAPITGTQYGIQDGGTHGDDGTYEVTILYSEKLTDDQVKQAEQVLTDFVFVPPPKTYSVEEKVDALIAEKAGDSTKLNEILAVAQIKPQPQPDPTQPVAEIL